MNMRNLHRRNLNVILVVEQVEEDVKASEFMCIF